MQGDSTLIGNILIGNEIGIVFIKPVLWGIYGNVINFIPIYPNSIPRNINF